MGFFALKVFAFELFVFLDLCVYFSISVYFLDFCVFSRFYLCIHLLCFIRVRFVVILHYFAVLICVLLLVNSSLQSACNNITASDINITATDIITISLG